MKQLKGILVLFSLTTLSQPVFASIKECRDPTFRQQVAQVSKEKGVKEEELLSIIAHESGCHFYTIAWNLPGKPESAKSKLFQSKEEAKIFAQDLISTGKYRVDVGIGQINNEAHLQPKGWSLEEVLNPNTALHRVAEVLKERGWANYHSENPILAKKWQGLVLAALERIDLKSEVKFWTTTTLPQKAQTRSLHKKRNEGKTWVLFDSNFANRNVAVLEKQSDSLVIFK